MKLNDEVIAHIAKILQMALITGTDIVDHLRMMVLDENEGILSLNQEYNENNEANIQRMIDESLQNQNVGEM
jgi:hypothetical protein|tara:strand:- start:158 stop:373 length:216 start_codon:yes stop_codon:yes gene_type:complete